MAQVAGNEITIEIGETAGAAAASDDFEEVGGITASSFVESRERVDTTNADSNGDATALVKAGTRLLTITGSGVYNTASVGQDRLKAAFRDKTSTDFFNFKFDNGAEVFAGKFVVESLESTLDHDGALGFSATFTSSGGYTVTDSA